MKPRSLSELIQELKRRRVFRGIVVYGASTLILLEAAGNIYSIFGIETIPKWFLLLLGLGFLGSLWFSWIYDFTPGGIVKTEAFKDEKVPIPNKKLKTYRATTFLSLVIIIGLLSYKVIDNTKARKIASLDKSIAVLPLHDIELSQQQSRQFEFVGHEITSCLLKVKDYRVVPWEDSRRYPRIGKTYNKMGKDLSAAILVDWRPHETNGERHLSVDLIAVEEESLLWSENYRIEGDWTGAEIFKYSRKISKKITRKLRTYLTLEERARMNELPVSIKASMFASLGVAMTYDAREMAYMGKVTGDTVINEYLDSIGFDRAINYFTAAIEEDPEFAIAYAERARTILWGIDANFYDKTKLPGCETDIRKAFELEPDLPEAHIAMGFYYYYGLRELVLALTSFEKAVELSPDKMEYVFYLSIIRRALGHWKEVQTLSDRVFDANPHNVLFLTNLGISYLYLLDFPKSIECQDRAIELVPNWYAPYINKIDALISLENFTEARAVVTEAKEKTGKEYYRTLAVLDLYEGNYKRAIENIEKAKAQEFKDLAETRGDAYLLKAKIFKHAGKSRQANGYYQMAIDFYNKQIMFNPEDYRLYSKLGIAYAGKGVNRKAIENGKTALVNCSLNENKSCTLHTLYNMIQLYALLNDDESAQNMINELLDRNHYYTKEFLNLDPDIQPILDDPGL